MKFYCGKTLLYLERAQAARRDWRRHFAWLPVTIDRSGENYLCCWLETVERRDCSTSVFYTHWEYRRIKP